MATLAGLEFLKIQETARHNRATEQEAAASRHQGYDIAREDRESRERINQASLDNAVAVQKMKSQSDVDKERIKADASRYSTDMQVVKSNPFLNTGAGIALAAERLGSGNWGDGKIGSAVKQQVSKAVDTFNNIAGSGINLSATQPLAYLENLQNVAHQTLSDFGSKATQKVEDIVRSYLINKFSPYSKGE